jgi:ABC-2 type transport system permease protein
MTVQTTTRGTATPVPAPALEQEPRARLRDVVAAEWIKLWSLRSSYWVLGLTALAVIGLNAYAAIADYQAWPETLATSADIVPSGSLRLAFGNDASVVLMLAAGAMGANVIVSEYGSGLIRTTFVAVPARRSVMAAKLAVVTPVLLVFGTVVSAASFGVTQAILSGRARGVSIADPGALRVVAASALLAPASALVGMAIGTIIRHTATAMVATPLVLNLLPTFVNDSHHWNATLKHAMLAPAWQRLTEAGEPVPTIPYRATVTGSWLVVAAWSLVASIVAVTAIRRRDL